MCATARARAHAIIRNESRWKIARTKSQWKFETTAIGREMPIECNRETRAEFYWLFVARELLHKHDHLAVAMWKKEETSDAGNNIIDRRPLCNAHDGSESMAAVTFQLKQKTLSLPICCALVLSAFHKSNHQTNGGHRKRREKKTNKKSK